MQRGGVGHGAGCLARGNGCGEVRNITVPFITEVLQKRRQLYFVFRNIQRVVGLRFDPVEESCKAFGHDDGAAKYQEITLQMRVKPLVLRVSPEIQFRTGAHLVKHGAESLQRRVGGIVGENQLVGVFEQVLFLQPVIAALI